MTICNQNRVNCNQLQSLIELCNENITVCEDTADNSTNLEILKEIYYFCNATDKQYEEEGEHNGGGKSRFNHLETDLKNQTLFYSAHNMICL